METTKQFIKNRNNEDIAVKITIPNTPAGLAFVMHGLGGFKEQEQIEVTKQAFLDHSFISVTFDVTDNSGESEQEFYLITLTKFYETLEDVVQWTQGQEWYQEPFALSGHSLGGYSVLNYVVNHPNEVAFAIPLAPVLAGELSVNKLNPETLEERERTGVWERTSRSLPDVVLRLDWHNFRDDLLGHDLRDKLKETTTPLLFILGEDDQLTQSEVVDPILDKMPGRPQKKVIPNARHTWRDEEALSYLTQYLNEWLVSWKNTK